jgi:hypothetical protein
MVEVIQTLYSDHAGHGGGAPLIHIHYIEQLVKGNGCAVRVHGEMQIAAGERVWAREMGMKTLQVLNLTPEIPLNNGLGYMAQKYIHHKGDLNNYASIDIYDDASTWQSAGTGPSEGSVWLDFVALGE